MLNLQVHTFVCVAAPNFVMISFIFSSSYCTFKFLNFCFYFRYLNRFSFLVLLIMSMFSCITLNMCMIGFFTFCLLFWHLGVMRSVSIAHYFFSLIIGRFLASLIYVYDTYTYLFLIYAGLKGYVIKSLIMFSPLKAVEFCPGEHLHFKKYPVLLPFSECVCVFEVFYFFPIAPLGSFLIFVKSIFT